MDYSILMWLLKAFLVFCLLLFAFGALGLALILSDTKAFLGELILKTVCVFFAILIFMAFCYAALVGVALLVG